jgi:hypothetical protein
MFRTQASVGPLSERFERTDTQRPEEILAGRASKSRIDRFADKV